VLPGKKYSPEDILRIAWHRKWVILVPFVVAAISTAAISHRLPKKYRSETVILVIPQRVPENYVRPTVTTRIEDRLTTLREQILSRSRLERIVQDFDLYPETRKQMVMEDVIVAMRNDIDVKVERGDAFRVSYVSSDPRTAQKVTERLASLFIEENLRDRELQAEGTNQFLDSQLEEARRNLLEHEKKLESYQRQYAGQLPNQVQANMQAIQSAQMQLQSLTESINRDTDRRLMLERQIADLQAAPADSVPVLPAGSELPAGASAAQQLEAAEARLHALESRLKPEHPDVKALKSVIRDLEAKAAAEAARQPAPQSGPRPASAAELIRQNRLRDLTAELKNLDNQLTAKRQHEKQLTDVIASYQSKIDAVPTREAELTELTRDYATLQTAYTTLLARREDSKVAANLERNQRGEQFKVLDPARIPERPASPQVMKINVMGAGLGLMLGLGIVALLEYRDTSFKTEEDVKQLLQLPVLALIPMMASERERRNRKRRLKLLSLGAAVVVLSSAVVLVLWKLQIG
jgi:polysaccharide chain length determinant protein (PEP-CTERM system associated)